MLALVAIPNNRIPVKIFREFLTQSQPERSCYRWHSGTVNVLGVPTDVLGAPMPMARASGEVMPGVQTAASGMMATELYCMFVQTYCLLKVMFDLCVQWEEMQSPGSIG